MLFRKYIRKQIIKILCDIKNTEEEASKCAEDFVKNDKYYEGNPYRGVCHGYISGVNWISDEILKRL